MVENYLVNIKHQRNGLPDGGIATFKKVCDNRDRRLSPVYVMQVLYHRTTPSAKKAGLNWDVVFQSSCFLEMTDMIWDKGIKGLIFLIPVQSMTEAPVFIRILSL